jgi:hypothetical protein
MPTTTDNNSILALLQIATKAWAKGGGMGASSGLGGRGGGGGRGVSKPGSRGGKFWISPSGHVEYGAKPSGARGRAGKPVAKPQAVARHTSNSRVAANRAVAAKPKKPLGKLQQQHRMLSEMDRAIKTGMDPHGNKLSPANIEKLRFLATSLRTDLKGNVKKEIAEQAAAHLPFTVFKDKSGKYRWVGVSSSAAQDHDGETVSLKALAEDVASKDMTGTHGPLNWWHTSIKLGTCDFNAMDGPLLVESGTFVNDRVASAVSKAISDGKLKPAMSLEFQHNEPGPAVLPGRVFQKINKIGRALLPAEKASNLLTSFKVYSLKSTALAEEKDSKKMLDEEKHKKALEVFGQDTLQALLDGNQTALKMAEMMNLSFKAAAVAEPPVEVAAPEPAPVVVEPPVVAPVVNEVVAEPEAETETEDAPLEIDPAVMFDGLAQAVADKVLASMASTQATATKEVNDVIAAQTLALKENTGALNKVVAENVALKARLDALEGNLPAGVRARVTQQPGISAKQLAPEHAGIVTAEKNTDPYLAAADRMMQTIPRG